MKFLYFLLAIVVIALITIEANSMVKIPNVEIHTAPSGMVYAYVGDRVIVLY